MNQLSLNETTILDALRQVVDPELGLNIVDLGLIYDVAIEGQRVRVAMTLTSPGCPLGESIRDGAHAALLSLEGVTEAQVDLVFDPPWTPAMVCQPTTFVNDPFAVPRPGDFRRFAQKHDPGQGGATGKEVISGSRRLVNFAWWRRNKN